MDARKQPPASGWESKGLLLEGSVNGGGGVLVLECGLDLVTHFQRVGCGQSDALLPLILGFFTPWSSQGLIILSGENSEVLLTCSYVKMSL